MTRDELLDSLRPLLVDLATCNRQRTALARRYADLLDTFSTLILDNEKLLSTEEIADFGQIFFSDI